MLTGLLLTAVLMSPGADAGIVPVQAIPNVAIPDPQAPPGPLPTINQGAPIIQLPAAGSSSAPPQPMVTPPASPMPMPMPMNPGSTPGANPPSPGANFAPGSMGTGMSGQTPMSSDNPQSMAASSAATRAALRDTHLGPPHTVWASADYRLYWLKPGPLPMPLLSAVDAAGNQRTLIGEHKLDYGRANAFGFNAGKWLNERHSFGVMLGGFITEQRASFAAANSDAGGFPGLVRPYTDALLSLPGQVAVATPGLSKGAFWTESDSRVASMDLTFLRNLYYCKGTSVDLLIGGQYFNLDESLAINQITTPFAGSNVTLNNQLIPGNGAMALAISDRFRTSNQFWGGTLGLRGEQHWGPIFANATAKVGLGSNYQDVQIDGSSRVTVPGAAPVAGGLLALPNANLGRHGDSRFAVMSELGAQIGMQLSQTTRIFIGYDFFYLSSVARPGTQIDPIINSRLVPTNPLFGTLAGVSSPIVTNAQEDFYIHGVRFGMQLMY